MSVFFRLLTTHCFNLFMCERRMVGETIDDSRERIVLAGGYGGWPPIDPNAGKYVLVQLFVFFLPFICELPLSSVPVLLVNCIFHILRRLLR